MRGVVAMVDRNVQIIGAIDRDEWGAHVVVAGSRLFDSKLGKIRNRVGCPC